MWKIFILLVVFTFMSGREAYIVDPGPKIIATKGEVWPKPSSQQKSTKYYIIRPDLFEFKSVQYTECEDFLQEAYNRYWKIINGALTVRKKHFDSKDENFLGYLTSVAIDLTGPCDSSAYPEGPENYEVGLDDPSSAHIMARTQWGILRGLETFSQLIYNYQDSLAINATVVQDSPRFSYRGLHMDTSRHYIPLDQIYKSLDAMAYNKLNVFHWHIVDDQSFPYKSRIFPELSEQGAYHPQRMVYTQYDIQNVIEYARLRGIRVIPEFDTPGHTRSWGVSHPELLTACYNNSEPTGQLGPMDPTKPHTYEFLDLLFSEVVTVFPDQYFHIGGDEVGFECWESNPDIKKFMDENNITNYVELETYFIQNVVNILNQLKTKYLVWEEVFVNGVKIPNDTIVHVWRDNGLDTVKNVTDAGYYALYSSCWYLDHLKSGGDWEDFYKCDPQDFVGKNKDLVLGGEACMWAEVVNEYNIQSRTWPRASAAAEKLWTNPDLTNDIEDTRKRIEEHACRLNKRGIGAQPPNGPGVCL